MTRALVFAVCLAAGLALLVWQAGGLRGPISERPEPVLREPEGAVPGASTTAGASLPGATGLRVNGVDGPRYALPEARTFRDPRSGESVDLPYFVPFTFSAATGRPLPDASGEGDAVRFDDVVVRSYREPATLEEARRLRSDPLSIDALLRLELFARHARADGIARYLRAGSANEPVAPDATIRLEGEVAIHDVTQQVWMRGREVLFDPKEGRAQGLGPFTVEHAAWRLEGEDLVLLRDARVSDLYRVDVRRNVLFTLRDAVVGGSPAATPELGAEGFRPSRVLARRASLLHDAGAGRRLYIALEDDVRALQQGGRRLTADRLRLTLEESSASRRAAADGWRLLDLSAEGTPLTIEVPDLEATGGARRAHLSARRLQRESSAAGEGALVLEGDPVVLLEGDLALPGVPGEGGWIRASARDRAVLSPVPVVARNPDGSAVRGRRLVLDGNARLERGGTADAPYQDVLEGDEITLTLRPLPAAPDGRSREQPVAFAAVGQVRLSGTRVSGGMTRIVVERLDTADPVLWVDGPGTRLSLAGLAREQHLLGSDPPPALAAGPPAPGPDAARPTAPGAPASVPAAATERETSWVLDTVDASGALAAETRLGGPVVGLPTWVEGDRATYERVSGRTRLTGASGRAAAVRVEAGPGRQHLLRAPTLTFEQARGRMEADGGAEGEVWLLGGEGDPRPMGLDDGERPRGALKTLTLTTDERIEVQFRLDRPGGEPALDQPQRMRVLGPFVAQVEADRPDAMDRIRANRLELVFARRAREGATPSSSPSARAAAPASRPSAAPLPKPADPDAPRPPGPGAPTPTRFTLAARRLMVDLEAGQLASFDAEESVVVDSEALHVEGETLRFKRSVGALILDGGAGRARARFGAAPADSRLEAAALRVLLQEDGPRWILASGPAQAIFVQAEAGGGGGGERFEVDCRGDVRITRTELVTQSPTWIRRTTRARAAEAWSDPSQIWSDRLEVRGTNLLARPAPAQPGRPPRGGARTIDTVVAEGPETTFESGAGAERIQMICERILVDVAAGTATLTGRPGRDVLVVREGRYQVELERTVFDFRTRQIDRLESGSLILKGRR